MSEHDEKMLAEHARLHALWRRNLAKRFDPRTKPTARFTYAAHVTKLENKLRTVEGSLARAGVKIPMYEVEYEAEVTEVIKAGYAEQRAGVA